MRYKQNQDLNQDFSESYSGFSLRARGLVKGREDHKSSSDPFSFPSGCTGVSMGYGGSQDPESNPARLLNKPNGESRHLVSQS